MTFKRLAFTLAIATALATPAFAANLKIGIGEDPDALDPDQSRTFVGEVVFARLRVDLRRLHRAVPEHRSDLGDR